MSEAVIPARWSAARDYLELSKSGVVKMILLTTTAGFIVARPGDVDFWILLLTLFGTCLVAAGTNGMNQYVEREQDGLMRRTRTRPLPAGRIDPRAAFVFSVGAIVVGGVWLSVLVNPLTAILALTTTAIYLFVYTPLKRKTSLSTIVGALPGAIPPMIGWAAATGRLEAGAWALFALLAIWQLPHFLAIGYMYREDYERGGFRMLSLADGDGRTTALAAMLYALTLLPLSLLLPLIGVGGYVAGSAAFLAAIYFVWAAWRFFRERTRPAARSLFMASNVYLVIVMAMVVVGSYL